MNKTQLQEKAKSLNIDFKDSDTSAVLKSKIAEKVEEQEKAASKQDEKNASNQSGGSIDSEGQDAQKKVENQEDPAENADTPTEDAQQAESVGEGEKGEEDPKQPGKQEDKVVLRINEDYEGASYQVGPYVFTPTKPFAVVDAEVAEKILDGSPELKRSSDEELKEYYADSE